MQYIPLTKIVKLESGEECVACSFMGTEKCQIHTCGNCTQCRVYAAILNQLHEFEMAIGGIQYKAD